MSRASEPRPYVNPYVAGTLLGVVLFLLHLRHRRRARAPRRP